MILGCFLAEFGITIQGVYFHLRLVEKGKYLNSRPIIFRIHAVERMFAQQISAGNVRQVLESGEMIEDSPTRCQPRAA